MNTGISRTTKILRRIVSSIGTLTPDDCVRISADLVSISVEELAKKKGASMAQISLAWIMSKPGVSAPIIGTTNLSNLEDILG